MKGSASVALDLAGDDSRFVTGDNIPVDGGLIASGTRMSVGVNANGGWSRYSGFGHGITGKPIEKRRIES